VDVKLTVFFLLFTARISTLSSFWLWIGGTDRSREGGWSWSDGSPLQFINWAGGKINIVDTYTIIPLAMLL